MREAAPVNVAQLSAFYEMIGTRAEGEFAADHVSGAGNCRFHFGIPAGLRVLAVNVFPALAPGNTFLHY